MGKTGLPILPEGTGLLGVVLISAKNWFRLPDARADGYKECSRLYKRDVRTLECYGPFWEHAPIVWTKDPEVIRHVSKENFENYVKTDGMRKILASLANQGIFSVNHGVHFFSSLC